MTGTPDRYLAWQAANQDYLAAVDAAAAAGERPPLWDNDYRYPDQVVPCSTVRNPGWWGEGGDTREYIHVTKVIPDQDDPAAVLLCGIEGDPVRVYKCDPVEVLTPQAADLIQSLIMSEIDGGHRQ
jgi:hypothetical protein